MQLTYVNGLQQSRGVRRVWGWRTKRAQRSALVAKAESIGLWVLAVASSLSSCTGLFRAAALGTLHSIVRDNDNVLRKKFFYPRKLCSISECSSYSLIIFYSCTSLDNLCTYLRAWLTGVLPPPSQVVVSRHDS